MRVIKMNKTKIGMNHLLVIVCVLSVCLTAIPILLSNNATAAATNWSYSNNMWKGTYDWDATYGPKITIEYNDGGTWRTAAFNAYPGEVKFNRNNGVRTLGICFQGGSGTYHEALGSGTKTTYTAGGAGANYWRIEWNITVPNTQGVLIYESVWFKAEGTTEATAKLTFGIDLKWEKTGDCSDQDDVNWMENWWYIDFDMGNSGDTMIDKGQYPTGVCLAYEDTWDMASYGIAFYDNTPGDTVYNNDYSYTGYQGSTVGTRKWGGFKLGAESMSTFADNDDNDVIVGDLWLGIFAHQENPGRATWYGLKAPLKLDLR